MGKYLIKVNMKVLAICLVTLLFIIVSKPSFAINENPLVPYIDRGDGYGVNPGGATPTKTPSEQVREKQSGIIRNIFEKLFGQEQGVIPVPTSVPSIPTPTSLPNNVPTTNPSIIKPTPTISVGDGIAPNTTQIKGCPPGNTKLHIAGTVYQHLDQQFDCHPPRMFVVHWSAGWSTAQATFDVLNTRERSCQFAIDDNTTLQMLDFYDNAVQLGWCAGGNNNVGSINYELTGVYFDDVLQNPNTNNYQRLMKITDKAVGLTCKFINKYNIPKTAIYGHYELQTGKQDPGPEYLKYFKNRVETEC